MDSFARPLEIIIKEFMKLPSVGPKSARRMAFHFACLPHSELEAIAGAVLALKNIKECPVCHNYSEESLCRICSDASRDSGTICVISDFRDLHAVESAGNYKGVYHILGGLISPYEGIGPDELNIADLIVRAADASEVIIATNPDVNGETTALYILREIRKISQVTVSRIAYGVPAGSHLEYADGVTISKAIEGRKRI